MSISPENKYETGSDQQRVNWETLKNRVAELEKNTARTIEQTEELAELYVAWAAELSEHDDSFNEILDLFAKAEIALQSTLALGEEDEIRRRLGNVYLHRAVTYNDYERFEPALESYGQAIVTLKPLEDKGDGEAKYDIAGIRLNRGIIYQELGEFEKAKNDFEDSFTAFRAVEKISDLDTRFYMAKVSVAQGNLFRDMDEPLDKVVDAYNRAMRLFVELIDIGQMEHERELANTLLLRCKVTYDDYINREFDSETERLNKVGDVLIDVGRGIEILEKLAKNGNFENRYDLFQALITEGTMLLDIDKKQEAYNIFDRSIRDFAEFIDDADPVVLNSLAVAYENHGIAAMNIGNVKESLADFDKAIEIKEQFLGQEFGLDREDQSIFLPTLATSYANRANVYASLGNLEQAKKDAQHGLDIIRSLKEELGDELVEIEQIFENLLQEITSAAENNNIKRN
ncbi:MAG: tetratricopeptide repeat protein [Planctomycetaceae bacterium]|jgi:tetratricopeptide (TPR) repeat protein|nr:tetratricopeptide repeat protein [Planctomycetaceae bacterium]